MNYINAGLFIYQSISKFFLHILTLKDLPFHNSDINTVFDLSNSIYNQDYEKIKNLYKAQPISTELALVVGAITESQELALEYVKKYW